jgi:hypothetical protein
MLVRKIVEHSGNMSGSDGLEWRWASKARSALGCYAHNLASVPEEMYNAFFRAMFPAEMLETYPWTYRKITPDERGWYR